MTNRTSSFLCALAAASLAACSTPSSPPAPATLAPLSSAPALAPTSTATEARVPVEIALAPQRFGRAKLGFDGLADLKLDLTEWDVGGVFHQGRYLANHDERFEILVRAHRDETLAGFERDHAAYSLSKPSSLQICGRSATLLRATREEQHIACVIVAAPGQNHPACIPPIEIAAVAFEHDHLGVVMTVEVVAADPVSYRPLVDRILASIGCH